MRYTYNRYGPRRAGKAHEFDTTPIRKAFAALRKAGYKARMNFSCCSTCGWYELGQQEPKDSELVVFYHRQAHDRLMAIGNCNLQWSGDPKFIAKTLEDNGVRVVLVPLDDSHTIEIDISGKFEREEADRTRATKEWDQSASLAW